MYRRCCDVLARGEDVEDRVVVRPGLGEGGGEAKPSRKAFGVAAAAGHVRAECVGFQLALGHAGIVRVDGGQIERGLRLFEVVHADARHAGEHARIDRDRTEVRDGRAFRGGVEQARGFGGVAAAPGDSGLRVREERGRW